MTISDAVARATRAEAEIDRLKAELAKLRALCDESAEALEDMPWGDWEEHEQEKMAEVIDALDEAAGRGERL